MALGGSLALCNDHFVADGAVLALGFTGCSAGRLNSRVNDFGMSLGGNLSLCNDDFVADGAVLAFGQTSLSAGWSLCCIDYFCVTGRGDFFHTGENRITNGALRTGRMTSLGAGSGLFRNFNQSMSSRADCFGFAFITNRAGVSLDTGIAAGRGSRNHALVPAVTLSRNFFLSNKHFVADRAMFAFGLAGCGAGSFNGFVNNLGVTRSRNNLGLCFFADRAGVGLYSVRYTAGFGSNHTLIPLMVTHGNFPLTVCVRNYGTRSDLCSLSIGVVCVV